MEILARSVGRRKEAVATLKVVKGNGKFVINNKTASDYLHNNSNNLMSIQAPLEILQKHLNTETSSNNGLNQNEVATNSANEVSKQSTSLDFDIVVKVEGGGLVGQAEAIKLAVARAVCLLINAEAGTPIKKALKDKGYLTQDARVKERRKYGLKKARKAPQYNKR